MHFTNFLLQPVINCSRRRVCSLFLFQAQPTAVALWSHWHFLVRLTHELHLRIGPALTINISNLKAKRRHSEQFQELPFSQKICIFYYKIKKLNFSLLLQLIAFITFLYIFFAVYGWWWKNGRSYCYHHLLHLHLKVSICNKVRAKDVESLCSTEDAGCTLVDGGPQAPTKRNIITDCTAVAAVVLY